MHLCRECMHSTVGKCTVASELPMIYRMHVSVCQTGVTVHPMCVSDGYFFVVCTDKTVEMFS